MINKIILMSFFVLASAQAIEYKEAKLVVWKSGESMYGEEFVVSNEAVVDYLATLERPTNIFKTIAYTCQVKTRTIRPTVWNSGGNNGVYSSYTYITHAYDIKDCVKN